MNENDGNIYARMVDSKVMSSALATASNAVRNTSTEVAACRGR